MEQDNTQEPEDTDDREPTEEDLARLAALETAWDRSDVKALMQQRDREHPSEQETSE